MKSNGRTRREHLYPVKNSVRERRAQMGPKREEQSAETRVRVRDKLKKKRLKREDEQDVVSGVSLDTGKTTKCGG